MTEENSKPEETPKPRYSDLLKIEPVVITIEGFGHKSSFTFRYDQWSYQEHGELVLLIDALNDLERKLVELKEDQEEKERRNQKTTKRKKPKGEQGEQGE